MANSRNFKVFFFSKLEGKVQELQSRLDAELDARDKISQTSHSVQNRISQLEKQVWDLTDQLKKETDAHTKVSKSHSDLQKVQFVFFKVMNYTPYSKMAANKLFFCLHVN